MDVLGFQEALEHCVWVKVDDIPELKLPVASPVRLGLLKLIAWSERDAQARKKDAADLAYLAANYENLPGLSDELYENHVAVLESYGWDTCLSGAHVLGREVEIIASSSTLVSLRNRLNEDQAVKLKDAETSLGASGSGVIEVFLGLVKGGRLFDRFRPWPGGYFWRFCLGQAAVKTGRAQWLLTNKHRRIPDHNPAPMGGCVPHPGHGLAIDKYIG